MSAVNYNLYPDDAITQNGATLNVTGTMASRLYQGGDTAGGYYGDVYSPNLWSARAVRQRELEKMFTHMFEDYSDDSSGYGATINCSVIVNLAANPKVDGFMVKLQQPVGLNKQIVIDQHWEASFIVEDKFAKQARLNMQAEYNDKAVEAIERTKDKDLAAYAATSAGSTAAGASNSTAVTDAIIIDAIQKLNQANVPMTNRHFVFSYSAMADVMKIDKYMGFVMGATSQPGSVITSNKVENGFGGHLYGVDVNFSNNLVASSGGSVSLLIHPSAIGVAVQKETDVEQERKAEYLGDLTVASGLWGKGVLRPDHIVAIPTH